MIADRIKLARRKAGFSLRDLSDAMQNRVTAQAIGKYERGEDIPSSGVLTALARALDDSDQQVRYSAVAGLAEITGETKWMPSIPLFKEDESPYLAHWHERVSKLISSQQR